MANRPKWFHFLRSARAMQIDETSHDAGEPFIEDVLSYLLQQHEDEMEAVYISLPSHLKGKGTEAKAMRDPSYLAWLITQAYEDY